MASSQSDLRFGLDRSVSLSYGLALDSGQHLAPLTIAYETYGELNSAKSNVILICHALTGDHHVASPHPITGKPGWWSRLVGAGKVIDPARHFIVCANVVGSCMGTSGPKSHNPATGRPYGMAFPVITIRDMVRAHALLLDYLGIDEVASVIGGSMGGMQVLEWATTFPERTRSAIVIAATAKHSAQNIAFHEVGRQAIMADPLWRIGDYYDQPDGPSAGLSVARMAAHITYMSEEGLTERFGRKLQNRDSISFGFDADFQIESYLRYQGISFVERFDANSYLYITRAMDYFDLEGVRGLKLAQVFEPCRRTRFCVISFTSDWLYPTIENRALVHALNAAGAPVSFVELETTLGHDSFLLDVPEMFRVLDGFLRSLT
jgi:homoserine O-acetyltransferase/O-succinyltransferase